MFINGSLEGTGTHYMEIITRIEPTLLKLEYCCGCCCCPSQFSKLCCWGGGGGSGGTSGDKLDSSCWISHSDSFDWSSDQILTLLGTRNTPTPAQNPHLCLMLPWWLWVPFKLLWWPVSGKVGTCQDRFQLAVSPDFVQSDN